MNGMGSQGLVNDANFGYPGAVSEMLLQSHTGEIKLLPALPKAWAEGEISGLVARGGFEIAMKWQQGILTKATVTAKGGTDCVINYNGSKIKLKLTPGESIELALDSAKELKKVAVSK